MLDEVLVAERLETELFQQLASQRARVVDLRKRLRSMFEEDDEAVMEEVGTVENVLNVDCWTVSESSFEDLPPMRELSDAAFDLWSSSVPWLDQGASGRPEAQSNQDWAFSEDSFGASDETSWYLGPSAMEPDVAK